MKRSDLVDHIEALLERKSQGCGAKRSAFASDMEYEHHVRRWYECLDSFIGYALKHLKAVTPERTYH